MLWTIIYFALLTCKAYCPLVEGTAALIPGNSWFLSISCIISKLQVLLLIVTPD